MNKQEQWNQWHNSLSPNTKASLKNAAIWRDSDLFKFCLFTFALGFIIGICF